VAIQPGAGGGLNQLLQQREILLLNYKAGRLVSHSSGRQLLDGISFCPGLISDLLGHSLSVQDHLLRSALCLFDDLVALALGLDDPSVTVCADLLQFDLVVQLGLLRQAERVLQAGPGFDLLNLQQVDRDAPSQHFVLQRSLETRNLRRIFDYPVEIQLPRPLSDKGVHQLLDHVRQIRDRVEHLHSVGDRKRNGEIEVALHIVSCNDLERGIVQRLLL